ncbi:MAG: hypothetical protein IJ306_08575 [Oscillospiraceae bacterium]|nr:hypothetical protein [Oscillospiraceae bacterium]
MENLEKILKYHFEKYPLMTAQDAVKLIHQNAKGCGHMVKNAEHALSMLENEMESIEPDADAQLLEPIGGGYVRLNLHAAKAKGILPKAICGIFVESADSGEKTELLPKLELLGRLAKCGKTPFSEEELSAFLAEYDGGIVRHSERYREAYKPAYRVVLEKLCKNLQ